ncbi:MAG: hypothetical protein R2708_28330 [Vicinamibacterales bacterium]
MPDYTNIDLAVSETDQAGLVDHLRSAAGPCRSVHVERLHADLDMWAQ